MPDGDEADFYVRDEKDACCVLALTADNLVVLVEEYRPGPNKVLLELPGGVIDMDDKNPLTAISREFNAETGYDGKLEFAGKCFVDAYSKRVQYCYVARNCKKVAKQKLEKTEFAEVVLLPLQEFRQLLRSGDLTDVEVGYLGLDYLELL